MPKINAGKCFTTEEDTQCRIDRLVSRLHETEDIKKTVARVLYNDPKVQKVLESDRHVSISRMSFTVMEAFDPIEVRLPCLDCIPMEIGKESLEYVMRSEGTLRCNGCNKVLVILTEDLEILKGLQRTIDDNNHEAYILSIWKINSVAYPDILRERPIGESYSRDVAVAQLAIGHRP